MASDFLYVMGFIGKACCWAVVFIMAISFAFICTDFINSLRRK